MNKGIRGNYYKYIVAQTSLVDEVVPDVPVEEVFEQGEAELPEVNKYNVWDYLADEYEYEPTLGEEKTEEPPVPFEMTEEETPEFGSTEEALQWATQNNKVVRINYITKKGKDLTRIVEPHAFFTAGTGNRIVVTYDRSVRKIRAFIVQNILNYVFTGKNFKKRIRVMPEPEKRIKPMENKIFESLRDVGDNLEKIGLTKSATIVTDAMNNLLQIKTAQYVGAQGYWLRNRRCWDNCYRHKRTSSPEMPAQEVWMSCWDEYKESINNDKSGWEKYASVNENPKFNKLNKKFADNVGEKITKGISPGEAIYKELDKQNDKYIDELLATSEVLIDLAEVLDKNGYKEDGKKLADVSVQIIKEAQGFWQGLGDAARGMWGKAKQVPGKLQQGYQNLQQEGQAARAVNIIKNIMSNVQQSKIQAQNAWLKTQTSVKNYLDQLQSLTQHPMVQQALPVIQEWLSDRMKADDTVSNNFVNKQRSTNNASIWETFLIISFVKNCFKFSSIK